MSRSQVALGVALLAWRDKTPGRKLAPASRGVLGVAGVCCVALVLMPWWP